MGRIEHDGIDILIDERLHAIHHVGRDADPRRNAQTAFRILTGVGMVLHFRNILIGNQSDELAVGIDYGQLLDFVAQQNVGRTLQVGVVVVTNPSLVITSSILRFISRWNRKSRLVTMPIKC